jgi:signal transduction histidine kinase
MNRPHWRQIAISTRVALYFGALLLAAMGTLALLWYTGLPAIGLIGASDQRLSEATQVLELSADRQRDGIRAAIEARRGDVLILGENKVIAGQLQERDGDLQRNVERVFDRLQRAYPDSYLGMQVLNPQTGTILGSSDPLQMGKVFPDVSLVERAGLTGVTELVEQVALVPGQGPTLAILRQIHAPDVDGYPSGRVDGILVAYLDLSVLLGKGIPPDQNGPGAGGVSLIFDQQGQVLARFPQGAHSDALFRRDVHIANGFEGTVGLGDDRGDEVVAVYRHLPLSGAHGWTLVHYQTRQQMLGGLNHSAQMLMLAGLLMTALGLVMTGLAARHLMRPMATLAGVARRFGSGEQAQRMPMRALRGRELLEVADAFNTMASQIEQSHVALEARVAERTSELQRSNAELEMFAYAASHDLQEPLRSVSSCVQLLQKRYAGAIDARADEFIAHAVGGSQRMQAMIDDLLTYSRVGAAGKMQATTDSTLALEAACANLSSAITQSAGEITHDPLPTVYADAGQLTQLFQNLVGNALKFRGERPAKVHVASHCDGREWVFSVADQGIGIEPQYFERIFRLFQRLHTRQEYSGTGIGLTICQKIVQRHGGRIWVESVAGTGSTFFFTLLVHEETRSETPLSEPATSPPSTPGRLT